MLKNNMRVYCLKLAIDRHTVYTTGIPVYTLQVYSGSCGEMVRIAYSNREQILLLLNEKKEKGKGQGLKAKKSTVT